jgi:hypothetical protein
MQLDSGARSGSARPEGESADRCAVAATPGEARPAERMAGAMKGPMKGAMSETMAPADDLLSLAAPDLAERLSGAGARLLVMGVTRDGKPFRPSDWADRLAGVLAPYRPAGLARARGQSHLGYSPLAVPTERAGRKCVIVDPALRAVEPLAWAFVLNFARDNSLETTTC